MAYTSPTIVPSGTTFAQFQAAGATGHLERLIAANLLGTSPPAVPTLTAVGGGTTGGTLPAGTYYIMVTETNGMGETTPCSEVSVTIAAGNVPQVAFAALQPGNTARNVYVGTASGAETLYATGVTTATFNLASPMPASSFAVPPPTANSTGLTTVSPTSGVVGNQKLSSLRACKRGTLQFTWDALARLIDQFNRGEPVSFGNMTSKLHDAHAVFAMLSELCAEMGALVDANPGHFTNVPTGIGGLRTVRRWP